jgi:hypothetical protein
MPRGTALRFDGQILVALRGGKPLPDTVKPWVDFLQRFG